MLPMGAIAQPPSTYGWLCGADRPSLQRYAGSALALTGAWLRPQLVGASGVVTTLEGLFEPGNASSGTSEGRGLCVFAVGAGRSRTLRFTVFRGRVRASRISENQRWMK